MAHPVQAATAAEKSEASGGTAGGGDIRIWNKKKDGAVLGLEGRRDGTSRGQGEAGELR
ncbi:MAG: hypothetical protein ACOCYW_06510 [Roseicyclus sp.]